MKKYILFFLCAAGIAGAASYLNYYGTNAAPGVTPQMTNHISIVASNATQTVIVTNIAAYQAFIATNDLIITEAKLSFSDTQTANATTVQHGLLPKLSGGTNDLFVGDGSWLTNALGLTTNIDVIIAGDTTNQLQFTKGILTAVVPQ